MQKNAVLFLDRPHANGMVHIWLREYFFEAGYHLVDIPMPVWKNSVLASVEQQHPDNYLADLDWFEMTKHTFARLSGMYDYGVIDENKKQALLAAFRNFAWQLEQCFVHNNVAFVVAFGNYRIESKLGGLFADKYASQVITLETFFLQQYYYLEFFARQVCNHHGYRLRWQQQRLHKLPEEAHVMLDELVYSRDTGALMDGYISQPALDSGPEDIAGRLASHQNKIALLLGQVAHDAVMINDLTNFADQNDFLSTVIESFLEQSDKDWLLVCRLHPLEQRYGDQTLGYLEQRYANHPRVLLISGQQFNTYRLMQLASFGIVANSQSGLEMAYRRKPVLVCAKPYYADSGCFLEATDRATLAVQMARLMNGWTPDQQASARLKTYLYGLITNYLCRRSRSATYDRLSAQTNRFSKDTLLLKLVSGYRRIKSRLVRGYGYVHSKYLLCDYGIQASGAPGGSFVIGPEAELARGKILLFGVGTLTHLLVKHNNQRFIPCSDNMADVGQDIFGKQVCLFDSSLLKNVSTKIIFTCPRAKAKVLTGKALQHNSDIEAYRAKKIQLADKQYYVLHPLR